MKKLLIAVAAAGFSLAPALASDLESYCVDYVSQNGGDTSGCSCLAETADADATAELLQVQSDADVEALSDNAKAAIAACFPDA